LAAIAFLVPTFNRAHFLGETLSAILAQMRDGDELLIIDDGSNDDTAAIVAAAGPRARYMRQDNSGKAAALNRGLAVTSAPLVFICDDDDILLDGAVESLAEAMMDPRLGFAFGRYTRFQDQPDGVREDMGTGYWPDLSSGSLARHMLEDAFVMQNAALVRREAYEAVGPFSEAMPRSLDYEMFVRLAVTQPCAYVDRLMFLQRKHEGARGPALMLHAAARSEDVWQRYDRLIFINLYRHAPLAFFEGMYEGGDAHRRRAGLLCRGGIMMRHGCWEEALSDLEAAAALPLPGLDAGEIRICRRALDGKHGFGGLLGDANALRRMAALARKPRGGGIVRTMIDGTMWRIRNRGDQRRQTLTLIYRALGLGGGMALAATRLRPSSADGGIRERDRLGAGLLLGPQVVPPVGVAESARAA
jgi:glycosyltransferase involved in cell wall biosynthesis